MISFNSRYKIAQYIRKYKKLAIVLSLEQGILNICSSSALLFLIILREKPLNEQWETPYNITYRFQKFCSSDDLDKTEKLWPRKPC